MLAVLRWQAAQGLSEEAPVRFWAGKPVCGMKPAAVRGAYFAPEPFVVWRLAGASMWDSARVWQQVAEVPVVQVLFVAVAQPVPEVQSAVFARGTTAVIGVRFALALFAVRALRAWRFGLKTVAWSGGRSVPARFALWERHFVPEQFALQAVAFAGHFRESVIAEKRAFPAAVLFAASLLSLCPRILV